VEINCNIHLQSDGSQLLSRQSMMSGIEFGRACLKDCNVIAIICVKKVLIYNKYNKQFVSFWGIKEVEFYRRIRLAKFLY